ncbi:MAG: hypothetical protein AAB583_01005 [Patescibacteria group bacterium]
MNDWKERMQREDNEEARKRQSSLPKKTEEEISREAGQILTKINAFDLLNKTREEIWEGEGDILSSKVINEWHRDEGGPEWAEMKFIPKNPWIAFFDTTCIAGLRLQTKFLSVSYRETGQTGGHTSDYSAKSYGGREYSVVKKEDHYSTTAIHIFKQNRRDDEKLIFIVRIWDGEFRVPANKVFDERLPYFLHHTGAAKPEYVATLTESFDPARKDDPDPFSPPALKELLYTAAKKRVRENRLPSQLAPRTISEIQRRWGVSEVRIIT